MSLTALMGFDRPAAQTDVGSAHRTDIDGLRAISVLAVILFHLNLRHVPGGYLGVDVFFVISGFLIGRQLIAEMAAGTFSFAAFYERRVRRIIPAAIAVVVICHLLAFAMFTPGDYAAFAQSQVAHTFFVSNFYFLSTTGYFDQLASLKPLLHTWSLSIEEQFYIFVPLGLWLFRRSLGRQFVILASVTLGSLALYAAWLLVGGLEDMAFYNSLSRVWQISVGGMIGWASVSGRLPQLGNMMAACVRVGAIAVLLGCLVLGRPDGGGMFWSTLAATAAAAALVGVAPGGVDALKFPGLPFLGRISYGLYLWHWPAIVFLSPLLPSQPRVLFVLVFAISFVCAWGSYIFIEQPVRRRTMFAARSVLYRFVAVGLVLLTAWSAVVIVAGGMPWRLPASVQFAIEGAVDKNPRWEECFAPPNWETYSIERIRSDEPCFIGAEGEPTAYAIVGDSHANALMPLFDAAGGDLGMGGVALTYSGCPPILGVEHVYEVGRNCSEFMSEAVSYIVRHDIKKVFLVGYWDHYLRAHLWDGVHDDLRPGPLLRAAESATAMTTSEEVDALVAERLRATVLALEDRAVTVVAQVPQQVASVPQAMVFDGILRRSSDWLAIPREDAEVRGAPSREIFGTVGVSVIDPLPVLCGPEVCAYEKDGRPIYYDDNHLSVFGSQLLRPLVARALAD